MSDPNTDQYSIEIKNLTTGEIVILTAVDMTDDERCVVVRQLLRLSGAPAARYPPGGLTTTTETYVVPVLIARAGDQAGWRYVEFFTANMRNPNRRRAYARACTLFFAWCEARQLELTTIRSVHVATWVDQIQEKHSAPGVKQQLT